MATVCFVLALRTVDFTSMNEFGAIPDLRLCIALIASLTILAFALGKGDKNEPIKSESLQRRKLPVRTKVAAAIVLLAVPLTLWLGSTFAGERSYYITALLVMLECMLPFFIVFEGRRPSSREIAVTAVLCALGVAGRAVFFMLPQFKPVLALTVIAGAAFGGETGFLVGAMTMLVSNMLFSQGPWTPWQMFAMGLVGFLAGILCESRLLKRSRGALCVFGGLAAIVVYGGIMNSASALIWQREVNSGVLLAYFATGFPMDCVHAAATVLFLWFGAEPMLEKLGRIKSKL
ncbi:MAG: ECF transporter S component [Candidatus Flemingiibacterium sp.]